MKDFFRNLAKKVPGAVRLARACGWSAKPPPQGEAVIRQIGHREYVGGLWDEIGRLQFDFLVSRGLKPEHYLCDVACGCLRGGVHFIHYLDKAHYLGIDKENLLIERGIEEELGGELFTAKAPAFVVSADFEFERFEKRPDFALAQSLFTHLPPAGIELCLAKLRSCIAPNGVFYATFFESTRPVVNPAEAHDSLRFDYTFEHMEQFGERHSWRVEYIGAWNHPRGQKMLEFRPQ